MRCPNCNYKTYVKETRAVGNEIIRLRECKYCAFRFYTSESLIEYNQGLDKIAEFHQNRPDRRKNNAD